MKKPVRKPKWVRAKKKQKRADHRHPTRVRENSQIEPAILRAECLRSGCGWSQRGRDRAFLQQLADAHTNRHEKRGQ